MKLYRVMKVDVDGKPLVGSGSMMLGLRPTDPSQPHKHFDVLAISGRDVVRPGEGGLSCYEDPAAITIQLNKKLILWSIETEDLPMDLCEKPACLPHYRVEPNRELKLNELQDLLANTRDLWVRE